MYTGQENAKSSNPVAIDGACPFAGLHIIEPDVVAELGQEEQRAEIAAAEMEQDAPPRLQAEEEEHEDMGTTEEECIYGAKLVQAGADGRTFFARWTIAEGLWKRAIIQLPKLKLDVSGIPGVHGYGVWTMYDIAKNAPLTFYGGIVVSKKVARALRKLHVGYHTHMKGIGQAETDDCHVLIGHCTAELPLYYFLLHHFLGSFINANKGTGLKPNVREVHQERPFTHPYDKDLGRVSKHLLVVAAVALPANTELLGTYDEAFWRETEESDHNEARRKALPSLPGLSSRDLRHHTREDKSDDLEIARQINLMQAREIKAQAEAKAREMEEKKRAAEQKRVEEIEKNRIVQQDRQAATSRIRKPPGRLENEASAQVQKPLQNTTAEVICSM